MAGGLIGISAQASPSSTNTLSPAALIAMLAGCSATSNAPQQSEKEDVERGVEQTPDGEKI